MVDLLELRRIDADELALSFKKASLEGKGTPQEVSDRREASLHALFAKYFPFPFRVAKGQINDSQGVRSNSIDCLVISPHHPYTINENNLYSFIFAEGVDFAIELKPDLSKKGELFRTLEQIKSVKKLTRKSHTSFWFNSLNTTQKEVISKIPAFIFSNTSYSNIQTLVNKITSYYIKNKISRLNQFDAIVINNTGILFNYRKGYYFSLEYMVPTLKEGLIFANYANDTLAQFLFWLNDLPSLYDSMGLPMIRFYISPNINGLKPFPKSNKELIKFT